MVNSGRSPLLTASPVPEEKTKFYAVLEFLLQLSMVYLLAAMFILIDLLLWAVRAKRFQEAKDRREAERQRHEDRRERRKLGERPAIPSRAAQPVASLAGVKIRRNAEKNWLRAQGDPLTVAGGGV